MSPLDPMGISKSKTGIGGIGLAFADIVGDAAAPEVGAGDAVFDALIPGDEADVPGPVDEDDVLGHQVVVVGPAAAQPLHEGPAAGDEIGVDIDGARRRSDRSNRSGGSR